MKTLKQKLTSRKFLVAVAGIVSGVALIVSGNVTEGVAAVIASVIGYLVAEGYIDAAAVKATTERIDATVDNTEEREEPNSIGFTD
ncbi:MAG: hypothetical protein IJA60_03805 [Clostridia bacterium]|nr:hypothetical protein [Clostridia bacterium]